MRGDGAELVQEGRRRGCAKCGDAQREREDGERERELARERLMESRKDR